MKSGASAIKSPNRADRKGGRQHALLDGRKAAHAAGRQNETRSVSEPTAAAGATGKLHVAAQRYERRAHVAIQQGRISMAIAHGTTLLSNPESPVGARRVYAESSGISKRALQSSTYAHSYSKFPAHRDARAAANWSRNAPLRRRLLAVVRKLATCGQVMWTTLHGRNRALLSALSPSSVKLTVASSTLRGL
ncbi:hypothetical protein MRX96_014886 [Rhipicephalus microplus]